MFKLKDDYENSSYTLMIICIEKTQLSITTIKSHLKIPPFILSFSIFNTDVFDGESTIH